MIRAATMTGGLGVVAAIVTSAGAVLCDVDRAIASWDDAARKGPLIIRVQHSSPGQGATDVLKMTRCVLHWQPAWEAGGRGQYSKDCSTSVLAH